MKNPMIGPLAQASSSGLPGPSSVLLFMVAAAVVLGLFLLIRVLIQKNKPSPKSQANPVGNESTTGVLSIKNGLILATFILAGWWGWSRGSVDPCDCVMTFNYHPSEASMSSCERQFGTAEGLGPLRASIACQEK